MENTIHSQPKEVDISDDTRQILYQQNQQINPTNQRPPYICMVASIYRDQNPVCFDPQAVSIGPLHRGHKNVQQLEGMKVTYLHDLLARLDSPPDQTLERCMRKVKAEIDQIRACYAGMKTYVSNVELAKLMVMDACFILEFIQKCSEDERLLYSRNRFLMSCIVPDLVLVENQIPFFVLQDIFELTLLKFKPTASLINLLIRHVLRDVNRIEADIKIDNHRTETNHNHILDILHKCYQPSPSVKQDLSGPTPHSVVELDRAGVTFKPNRDGRWPLAMEYELSGVLCFRWPMISKPTLRMPVMIIDDLTEQVFRNLIAYEQSSPPTSYYVTSYAWAMIMLVDNTKDVSKLVESNIIVRCVGSNEKAANLIKGICKDVYFTEFSYEEQWQQLDDYYNDYWPKNIAWLRRTYFNSPWNIIALMAGIVLFALTVVQTFFGIKDAYTKP